MPNDYYSILGVSKNATQDEIKKAYKKKAIETHPDRNLANKEKATEEFKKVNEAYSVLGDEQKRSNYDRFGSADASGGYNSGFNGNGGFSSFDFGDINDIFKDFFGGSTGSSRAKKSKVSKGADLRYHLKINLEDALHDKEQEISFNALDKCEACDGTGSKSKSSTKKTCHHCNGSGTIRMQQGFFIVEQTCHHCNGEGSIIADPCNSCAGSGIKAKLKKVKIQIPAGVDDGMTLKASGKGEAGKNGGQYGDLYISISIKDHKLFKRSGDSLLLNMPITCFDAILGCEKQIKNIDGASLKIAVPKGSQPNSNIVIKNQGMPILNKSGKRGDLIITLNVEIPSSIDKEQEAALIEIGKLFNSGISHPKTKSFFDNIKDIFT